MTKSTKGAEFIDTNILVYADDARDPAKQRRARELIEQLLLEQRGVVSLQVLQEFFAVATRKLGLASEAARRRIVLYSRFDIVSLSQADLLAAIDLHRLHGVSIWDALILRAALLARCRILHTEDMQAGFVVDTVTLSNPFAA